MEIEVKKTYQYEVLRALSLLGFTEVKDKPDEANVLKTFSRWIDLLERVPSDEEAKATWTELMLRKFGGVAFDVSTLERAGTAALHVLLMQQRFFPPRPRTGLDDGPELTETTRYAIDLVQHEALLANAVLAEKARWQDATCSNTPDDAAMYLGKASEAIRIAVTFQEETGCMTATGAGELIRQLRERAEKAEAQAQRIRLPIFGITPKDGDPVFVVTQSQLDKMNADNARLLADHKESSENARRYLDDTIRLGVQMEELSVKLAERDQDLLTAHAEIDRVRKAAQTLGLVSDQTQELLKLRAELATRAREVQTERERANNAELSIRPIEAQLDAFRDIVREARKAAGIDDGYKLSDWCGEARAKLDNAIIPLPKPEKVEPGQRWAFVMTCSRESMSGLARAAYFIDASGCGYAACPEDIGSGYYLGS